MADIYSEKDLATVIVDGEIRTSVVLRGSGVKSLGCVQVVHGDLGLSDSALESLGELREIRGDFWLSHHTITPRLRSLGKLQKVRGNASLAHWMFTDLGELSEVGGNLSLRDSEVSSLGKLSYVGGNLSLPSTFKDDPALSGITVGGKTTFWKMKRKEQTEGIPDNLLIKYAKKDFIPNIDCADFLKDKTSRKYDYIYTNPPWGADKNHQYQINGIKSKERASMFLVKAVDLLKPQGHLHFLLPTSLLKIQVHADVRKFILANCTIQNIELYKDRFDGVFTDYFSIKILPRPTNCQVYEVKKNNQTFKLTYTVTPDQSDIRLSEKNPLDESIKRKVALRANDYLTHSKWALGIVTGNNKEKLLSEREGAAEPIYTGKEIEPYTVAGERKYIVFDPANFQQCAKEEFFRAPEKLVYRFIANRPIVAYDDRQRLCLNSANILIPDVESLSTKTVAALLNSALYQYLYLSNFSDVKVLKSNLSSLPFPKLSSSEDSYFASIVDMIISHDSNAHRLCSLIDDRVFEIFDISSTERDWIMSKRFAE